MSNKLKLDWDLQEDEPITALEEDGKKSHETSYTSAGWKFYIRIKEYIPDWWYEFNGKLNHKATEEGRVRYRNINSFVNKKFKHSRDRELFGWMVGPKRIWEREAKSQKKSDKHIVPWLGDWDKRRKNGYWATENREQIKGLARAIKENVEGAQAIRATSPFIVQSLMRWVRLQDKIDELFDGQPFLMDEKPTSKNNYQRYKLYTQLHEQAEQLKNKTIEMWMRIHGVNPSNPHEMQDMATMAMLVGQSSAASALTGFTAALGNNNPNFQAIQQDGKPNGNHTLNIGGDQVIISPDALLLAQHLVQHSQTFKKALPAIDGEIINKPVDKKEKTNGHAKTN